MARLTNATGVTVEVDDERVETLTRFGFTAAGKTASRSTASKTADKADSKTEK